MTHSTNGPEPQRALATLSVLTMAAALSTGCLLHDVDKDPKTPIAVPDRFAEASKGGEADPGRWWRGFGDPDLDRLVERALTDNLEIKQAWARLKQAHAGVWAASAALSPSVDAQASYTRSASAPRKMNFGGQEMTVEGVESDSFNASFPMSYELDVWGRVRAGSFAADQDALAFRADIQTAATTLAANVAERWFDVIEKRAVAKLLSRQRRTNETYLELVELRFSQADAALSEIYQQQQQIQAIDAQLELVAGQERIAAYQLAVLIGQPPAQVVGTKRVELPELPPVPAAGVPAGLLRRRPDLRAAQRRLVAADYRIAEAFASFFPSLNLTGSVGLSSPEPATFLESSVWSFTGSAMGSIWDGGQRMANYNRSEAVLEERLYAYGQALLTAMLEVESSLVLERSLGRNLAVLRQQAKTADRTLEAARRRYREGLGDFLPVLTALRSYDVAEQSVLSAERQMLSTRVQLYRALGSRWTTELAPPPEDESEDEAADEEDA